MSAPVSIGEVIGQRYRVDRILGEGGMGVVVLATHVVLQQPVALKFLRREIMADQDAVLRFVREARAAAQVKSDHVVRVQDVGSLDDGTPFIVMEYVEGFDLATLVALRGPLEVSQAARYIVQTCEAIAETHAAGIVHADLKPENIYIAKEADGPGRVKLLDFGISRIVAERTASDLGTPAYMAPERFEAGTVDMRSEVWSLGAVLHEMLTGRPPFAAPSPEAIRERVLRGEPDPLSPKVPERLKAIIAKCLSRDRDNRYANTVELVRELEEFVPPPDSASQRLEPVAARIELDRERRFAPTVVLPGRAPRRYLFGLGVVLVVGVAAAAMVVTVRQAKERAAVAAPASGGFEPNPKVAPLEPVSAETVSSAPSPVDAPTTIDSSQRATIPVTAHAPGVEPPRTTRAPASPRRTAPRATAAPEGDRFGPRK